MFNKLRSLFKGDKRNKLFDNVNGPPDTPRPDAPKAQQVTEYGLLPLHAPPPSEYELKADHATTYYDSGTSIYYIKVQIDDHWEWHVDQKRMDEIAALKIAADELEKHKLELAIALQTRVISDVEMLEVMTLGYSLFGKAYPVSPYSTNFYWNGSSSSHSNYNETILFLQRAFNEAILQQFKLRAAVESVKTIVKPRKKK